MFSFKLDKGKLDKISSFCGTYIDIIFNNNQVLIASESGVSYIHLSCPAVSETGDSHTGFRVETKLFMSVSVTGKVLVEKFDSEISISFYGNEKEPIYKILVPSQTSFIGFERILQLTSKIDDSDHYSIESETRLVRLASKLKSPIICSEGYFYIYYKNSYVFAKTLLPPFSCESVLFKDAINLENKFYLIEDSLLVVYEEIVICIRRNKLPVSSDIPLLVGGKARAHYALDFRKLSQLMNRVISNNYSIKLNLSVNKCFIECDKGRFEVTVPSSNEIQANKEGASIDDMIKNLSSPSTTLSVSQKIIKLPYWVFKLLDGVAKVDLYVKRSSSLIIFNKVCIVIGGGFISEE